MAVIVAVIRILLSIDEKLREIITYTGLNDWRLRNEVDAIQRGISHIYTTNHDVGENLASRIWAVKNEITEIKNLRQNPAFMNRSGVKEPKRVTYIIKYFMPNGWKWRRITWMHING